jgi:hypothetical protein
MLTLLEVHSRCRNARAPRCDSARRLLARRVLAASEVQALLAALLNARRVLAASEVQALLAALLNLLLD